MFVIRMKMVLVLTVVIVMVMGLGVKERRYMWSVRMVVVWLVMLVC